MSPVLLLIHGWGFDAGFWAPLRRQLPELPCVAWDLGFHGAPSRPPLPEGRPVVAVGHSLGLLWLLQEKPLSWDALVSINGFTRFTLGPDFPQGVPPRLLERMIGRLDANPGKVYQDFMGRCGVEAAPTDGLDPERLSWGLNALAQWDCRAGAKVDLALAGRQDPILPHAMTETLFPGPLADWRDGGHLLPLTDPVWCAQRLRIFVESLT